jgi:hypothetical protein
MGRTRFPGLEGTVIGEGVLRQAVVRAPAGSRSRVDRRDQASPVPADDGVWLDDDKCVHLARPEMGEYDPEGAVTLA